MVTEQVGQRPARADGETRRASPSTELRVNSIIFRDDVVLHFVVLTNVNSRDLVDGGFDLLAVAIICRVRMWDDL
jgi:hypothetical protein